MIKPRKPTDAAKKKYKCVDGPLRGTHIWLRDGETIPLPFRGGRYVGGDPFARWVPAT